MVTSAAVTKFVALNLNWKGTVSPIFAVVVDVVVLSPATIFLPPPLFESGMVGLVVFLSITVAFGVVLSTVSTAPSDEVTK